MTAVGRFAGRVGMLASDADTRQRILAVLQVLAILVVVDVGLGIAQRPPWNNDAAGIYASVRGDLYAIPWLDHGAYVYSPAFAQAIWPLAMLPWQPFWAIWVTLQLVILVAIARPIPAALLLVIPWFPVADHSNPILGTITNGNPQLFIAGALVLAYRLPAAWAVPLLMKVTPGIGLVWYVARREWRNLVVALGATALVVAVSFVTWPDAWVRWLELLGQAAGADASRVELLYVPLVIRLAIATLLIVWGARTDRYWTVPIGATLALPAIAHGGLAVAVAALPFLRSTASTAGSSPSDLLGPGQKVLPPEVKLIRSSQPRP
jgi:hypothetical protein